MRIERMELQAYGSFHQRVLDLPEQGMTIIVGPNEAGKSTIFSYICSMLYGWSKRGTAMERYEPLNGGAISGRLTAKDRDGGRWIIERRDRSNGPFVRIQHVDPFGNMRERSQLELEQELLGGLHADLYNKLFAVTLDELHALHTLQGEELRSMLYDAGFDAGRSIAGSERKLQAEMDKLYKPRGRTQLLHETLKGLQEAERGKREQARLASRLQDAETEWKQERSRLEQLLTKRDEDRGQLAMMERALHVSDVWVKLVAVRSELQELPDLSHWEPQWKENEQALQHQLKETAHMLEELEVKRAEVQAQLAEDQPAQELLRCASESRRLIALAETVQHWRDDLHEVEVELEAAESELQRLARQSGPEWTPTELAASDMSQTIVENVREYSKELEHVDAFAVRTDDELRRASSELRLAEETKSEAMDSLAQHARAGVSGSGYAPDDASVSKLFRSWDDVNKLLSGLDYSAPDVEASVKPVISPYAPYIIGGIGILGAIGLGIAGEVLGAAGVALLGAVSAGWLWWSSRRSGSGRSKRGTVSTVGGAELRLAEMLRALERELAPVLERCSECSRSAETGTYTRVSRAGAGGAERADVSFQRLDEALEAVSAWARERERLAQRERAAHEACTLAERRAAAADEEARRARDARETQLTAWQRWLETRGLPAAWSPQGALEHARRVEQASELARKHARLEARAGRLRAELDAYREACVRVLHAAEPHAHAPAPARLPALAQGAAEAAAAQQAGGLPAEARLQRLLALIEREEARAAELQQRARELEALEQEQRRLEQRSAALRAELARLWQSAGAQDAPAFARLAQQAERYAACLLLQRDLAAACYRGGERESFAPLEALLVQHDRAALEQRCRELNEWLDELDRSIRDAEQQTGRLRQEEERLRQEAEQEQWMQRASELEAELHQQASRYVVHSLAKTIIASARKKYEQEKQPYVYKRAGQYISRMTAGRYNRVLSPLGTQQLAVQHEDGRIIDSAALSRGTMEQVYLAMRLALSDVMSERVSLPFVWDDIFVNFDPERLHQMLQVLPDMLEQRQVIWTTCHPHMVAAASQVLGDVHIIEL
ncbi:AAA family ATPase [Paenibacillus marinisediminis]